MIKKALNFLKKNWYGAVLTVACFLIAIEVLDTWAGWAAPFLCFAGWGIYTKLIK